MPVNFENLSVYSDHVLIFVLCSLQEQFHHILRGVRNERSDVKRDALKALFKLLRQYRVCMFV